MQVEAFLNWTQQQSNGYRSKHIAITMGEDFHYQDARVWFKNLDKLIK